MCYVFKNNNNVAFYAIIQNSIFKSARVCYSEQDKNFSAVKKILTKPNAGNSSITPTHEKYGYKLIAKNWYSIIVSVKMPQSV